MGNDRLKIQLVSTYYAPETTGNAPYVTGLAEGLAARGHEVSAVVGAPHYPGWSILPSGSWESSELCNGVKVERYASYVPAQPTFIKRVVYEVLYGLKFGARLDPQADAIVMVTPSLFGSAVVRIRAGLMRRSPSTVLWVQDLYSAGVREASGDSASTMGKLLAHLEGAIFRAFDRVVVIHERFLSYVAENLGVAEDKLVVVRNWTHVDSPTADRDEVRARLGWGARGETVVVHAGNMGAKQGLENVVDAARLAHDRDLPIRFVLIGDGNQRAVLQERAEGNACLEFMEPLPEGTFVDTLAAADVLLVNERPGLNEAAVPSKLTTYFATGRPVLAAVEPTSTTADEIRASRAGSTVQSGDPTGLVDAVLRMRAHPEAVTSDAGPRYVRDHLSSETALSSWAALIEDLVTSPTKQEARA